MAAYFYKKLIDSEPVGVISSSCEQPESDKIVKITESEFETIHKEIEEAESNE